MRYDEHVYQAAGIDHATRRLFWRIVGIVYAAVAVVIAIVAVLEWLRG